MVLAVNRTYGRPDQFDVDVVRAHLDFHPHPHDAVSVHLEALVPQLVGRALYGRIVRHRGDKNLPLSPVPYTDRHGDDRDATNQVDRLPAGAVQEQGLVNGEAGGHAPRP